MKTLAIIGQKGGTGKTTVTTGLAVTASQVGETVVIIDLDPQGSIEPWNNRRSEAEQLVVVQATPGKLADIWQTSFKGGADLIIIDTAGKSEAAAIEAAKLADLVLIPTRPNTFDMDTLKAVRENIRAAGDPPAFVLYNFIRPGAHRTAEEFKEITERVTGFLPCPVHMTLRKSYDEAPATGQAAQEIDPHGEVAAEMQRLYLFVKDQPTKGGNHVKKRHA